MYLRDLITRNQDKFEVGEALDYFERQEQEILNLLEKHKITQSPGVLLTLEEARKEIESIEHILSKQLELSVEERRSLMRERDVHEFYIQRFSGENVYRKLKVIEEEIERKKEIFSKLSTGLK